jgi:hypothetical protein
MEAGQTVMRSALFLHIIHEPDKRGRVRTDEYLLERGAHVEGESKLVWDLRKQPKSEPHTVTVFVDGRIECDCQDATFKHNPRCKHKLVLLDQGLLPKER